MLKNQYNDYYSPDNSLVDYSWVFKSCPPCDWTWSFSLLTEPTWKRINNQIITITMKSNRNHSQLDNSIISISFTGKVSERCEDKDIPNMIVETEEMLNYLLPKDRAMLLHHWKIIHIINWNPPIQIHPNCIIIILYPFSWIEKDSSGNLVSTQVFWAIRLFVIPYLAKQENNQATQFHRELKIIKKSLYL